jgi:hypothetical protein
MPVRSAAEGTGAAFCVDVRRLRTTDGPVCAAEASVNVSGLPFEATL